MKKILNLTVKKKWFDMIVSGEKKIEYREYKQYWKQRLIAGIDISKDKSKRIMNCFDEIVFRNGYKKNSPVCRTEFVETTIENCKNPYTEKVEMCFCIELGKILEVKP